MTEYAINGPNWQSLPVDQPIAIDDVATSYATMLAWSPQYRTAQGIKPIEDEPTPDGKIRVGEGTISDVDGKPCRTWEYEDAPQPTPEEIQQAFSDAIQAHLDATASERQYKDVQTAVTYRDDPNPQFAAEGEALFTWRSAVWSYALGALGAVQAGQRDMPTIEEMIAELPAFEWPVAEAA